MPTLSGTTSSRFDSKHYPYPISRLLEIVHDVDKLTLVFEYCKEDLKQQIDRLNGFLQPKKIKVKSWSFAPHLRPFTSVELLVSTS